MNLKKIIALALCVCMVLSFFPVSVFAEDWEDEVVLVDEEEYFEPQDEYVEEEIIIEEPADYVEYVEPVEEIVVEDELPAEEPAEELIEEPAEELIEEPVAPAAPVEEAAAPAAVTAELETAETFGAAPTANSVAKIGNRGYDTIAEALVDARAGDGEIELLKDSDQDVVLNEGGYPVLITGNFAVGNVTVSGEANSLMLSVKSIKGLTIENLTVGAGNVTLTNTTVSAGVVVNGAVSVTGGELSVTGGELKNDVTIGGNSVVKLDTKTNEDNIVTVNGGTLTITDGSYGDVVVGNNPGAFTGYVKGGTFQRLSKVLLADGFETSNYATSTSKYCSGEVGLTEKVAMVGTGVDRKYYNLNELPEGSGVPTLIKDATLNLTASNSPFKVKLNNKTLTVNTPDGYFAAESTTEGVTTYELKSAVAVIGEGTEAKYYDSLEAAIDAAYNGGTVELLTDVEYDVWNQNLGKGYNVGPTDLIIDGRNHTWTVHGLNGSANGNGNDLFHYANNLTVKNIVVEQRGDTTTSGAVTMMQGFGMNSGTLENVTIIGGRFGAVPSGSITVKNCTFDGMGTAVYWENEAGRKHVITGTTFKNTKATDVMGNMIFKDNIIESTATVNLGYNFRGAVLSETAQNSFTGNTIAGELDIYQNCDVEGNDLSAATIATKFDGSVDPVTAADLSDNYFGDNLAKLPEQVVISSVKTSMEPEAETSTVAASVLDGDGEETFYATFADAVTAAAGTKTIVLMNNVENVYALDADETLIVKLNEKTLKVTYNDVVVLGTTENGVTTYTKATVAEAKIGETPYATLAAALTAAQEGDTITLLKDATLTSNNSGITLPTKKLTIDIGGDTNTLTLIGRFNFADGVDLTVKNGNVLVTAPNDGWAVFSQEGGSASHSLTFDDVNLSTSGDQQAICFYGVTTDGVASLVIKNNSVFDLQNLGYAAFYTYGVDVTIENSKISITNSMETKKAFEAAFDYGTYSIKNSEINVGNVYNAAFYGISGTIDGSKITASVQGSNADGAHPNTKNNPAVFVQAETDNLTIKNTELNLSSATGNAFAEYNTSAAAPTLILSNNTGTYGDGTVSGVVAVVTAGETTRSFTLFAEAAAYAVENEAVVDLQAVPAAGDTYALNEDAALKVKLNDKLTDARTLVTTPFGQSAVASEPVDGIVTISLADQKYNISKMNGTQAEVVNWYDTFADAVAAWQPGRFIVIKESVSDYKFSAAADAVKLFFVKPFEDGITFTYTAPTGYDVATRLDTSGSGSTRYELVANTYTVKFNSNAPTGKTVTGTMDDQSFIYGTAQALRDNAFAIEGYHFQGWATSAIGDVEYVDKKSVSNLSDKNGGEVELFAKWAANTYTINFDVNAPEGATVVKDKMDPISAVYDKAYTLNNEFVVEGYTFTGWKTTSGSTISHTNPVSNLRKGNNGSVTLQAQWASNEWTADAYTADDFKRANAEYKDGTLTIKNAEIAYSPKSEELERPAGYAWVGIKFDLPDSWSQYTAPAWSWNNGAFSAMADDFDIDATNAYLWVGITKESVEKRLTGENPAKKYDWSVAFDLNNDGDAEQTIKVVVDLANIKLLTEDENGIEIQVENYEIKDKNVNFKVTFDSAGGTAVNEQSVRWNTTAAEPTAPTKDGYVFLGWFAGEATDPFEFTTPITAETNLTAHWRVADAYLVDKGNMRSYVPTIDDAPDWYNKHTAWYTDLHIYLNRDGVEYTLEDGKTLDIDLNDHTLTVLPADVADPRSTEPFASGLYYVVRPETESGMVHYSTAKYVAQVKTETYEISIGHEGEDIETLKGTSYELFKTFADAATDALTAGRTGNTKIVKTIILLAQNPTTYEITKDSLTGGKELRIDVGTIGAANLKAELGNEIKVENVSGTVYRYYLHELGNTWTVSGLGAGMSSMDPITFTISESGDTITASDAQIKYSPEDASIGRTGNRAWFGVKFTAPAAVTATAASKASATIKQGNNTWKFGTIADGDDFFYLWLPVDKTSVENNIETGTITWPVMFDLKADGAYEQTINVVLDLTSIKLTGLDDGVEIEVNDEDEIIDKNEYFDITFVTNNGTTVDAQSVRYNQKVTLPTLTRNGYAFDKWYTDAAFTQAFDRETPITSNLTLNAKWNTEEYTINYVLRGGTNAAANPATYNVGSGAITLTAPTRENWHFIGWTSPQLGQNTPVKTLTIPANSAEKIHATLNIGARWEYNVSFDTVGGTPAVAAQNNIAEGGLVTEPTETVSKTNFNFAGWYYGTKGEDGVVAYGDKFDFATAPTEGDITLYAYWTGNPRNISFIDEASGTVIDSGTQYIGDATKAPTVADVVAAIGALPATKYIDETDMWSPKLDEKVTVNRIYKLVVKDTLSVVFQANGVTIENATIRGLRSGEVLEKAAAPVIKNEKGVEAKWLYNDKFFVFGPEGTPVTDNITLVATWDAEPVEKDFAEFTYNMTLTENLNMNFYVRNIKDDPADYIVKVSIDGEDDQFFYPDNKVENIYTIAEFDARRMTDKIHVFVTDGDAVVLDKVYTIAGYCKAVIESTGNEKLKELANAILVYGANAQLALDYKTGNLPTEHHDVSGVIIPAATAKTKGSVTGVSRFGNQVMVDSIVTLRVLLQVDSTASLDDYTVTVNDTEVVPVKQSATIWYVDIPVSALKLGERQIVYVEDDDGMATYALTTIVPMRRVNNALTKALYAYYDAATAYATSI